MLTEYIEAAMSKAAYEQLEDGTYCGRIPDCQGTIAFGQTLYQCQSDLRSVLEGWLLVKMRHGDCVPTAEEKDSEPHADDVRPSKIVAGKEGIDPKA